MLRPYSTDGLLWDFWPDLGFQEELLILEENRNSIDSSEESQAARRLYDRVCPCFQNYDYVPPTEHLGLVNCSRHEVVDIEKLTDDVEALDRAVRQLRRARLHEYPLIEARPSDCIINKVLSLEKYPLMGSVQSTDHFLLPRDILWRVLDKLELIDLVRLSGVCKDWRELVRSYVSHVERLEYSLSTHLLRFRRWLHHVRFSEVEQMSTSWNRTALGLTLWTTNLAVNLKTLIVTWPIAWDDFVPISERCLNLKHLVCEYVDVLFITKLHEKKTRFISQLECLVLQDSGFLTTPCTSLLDSSVHSSLTIYSLTTRSQGAVSLVEPLFGAFEYWSMEPFQWFQKFPCFKLKYLRLHIASLFCLHEPLHLGQCLQSCPELLVLILEDQVHGGHGMLNAIAKQCKKLRVLWIVMSFKFSLSSVEEIVSIYQSLLEHDPRATFEEFHFVLLEDELRMIKDRVPFNLIDSTSKPIIPDRFSVKHLFIKNIIGTSF